MTLRNFPPADQCSPEDLDAIADLVINDPRASYDLAGSREHIEALCRRYQRLAQHLAEMTEERDDLRVRAQHDDAARTRLGNLTAECLDDLDSARTEIRALTATLDAERNERQAEVLAADADRQRADEAEARSEQLQHQVEALAMLLDGNQQTLHHNDHIQSAFASAVPAICEGKTIEQVNLELDEELAAHPDVGPLHHARDMRDHQEDSTP